MASKKTLRKKAQRKRRKARGFAIDNSGKPVNSKEIKYPCTPCGSVKNTFKSGNKDCIWCKGEGYFLASRFGW